MYKETWLLMLWEVDCVDGWVAGWMDGLMGGWRVGGWRGGRWADERYVARKCGSLRACSRVVSVNVCVCM